MVIHAYGGEGYAPVLPFQTGSTAAAHQGSQKCRARVGLLRTMSYVNQPAPTRSRPALVFHDSLFHLHVGRHQVHVAEHVVTQLVEHFPLSLSS
jgi:hypothetical protein